jgi:hypothetical protein
MGKLSFHCHPDPRNSRKNHFSRRLHQAQAEDSSLKAKTSSIQEANAI